MKPEIQYIMNPGGMNTQDAFVFGMRWEIVF
jgi:carbohydrate-selective porin OprB